MKRASYGQAARQALQPVHLPGLTSTAPPSFTWLAPVGHTRTHGGLLQWLQRSERISWLRAGKTPSVSVTIQSRKAPGGTRFSCLQAMTQALQPTHRRVSTVMA